MDFFSLKQNFSAGKNQNDFLMSIFTMSVDCASFVSAVEGTFNSKARVSPEQPLAASTSCALQFSQPPHYDLKREILSGS